MSMEAGEELGKKIAMPSYHSLRNAWYMIRAIARVIGILFKGGQWSYRSVRKMVSQTYRVALLQQKAGGDLHQMEVNPELAKYVQRELKARGVKFAREDAPDGKTYIHFAGRDVDTVQHCLTQANAAYQFDHPSIRKDATVQMLEGEREVSPSGRVERQFTVPTQTRTEDKRDDVPGAQSQESLSVVEGSDNPSEIGAGNLTGQDATRKRPAKTKTKRTRTDVKHDIQRRAQQIRAARAAKAPAPTPQLPSPKL